MSLYARSTLQRRGKEAGQGAHAIVQRRLEREWLGLEVAGGVVARCLGECTLEARSSLVMASSSAPVLVRSGAEEGASWQQPGALESARLILFGSFTWSEAVPTRGSVAPGRVKTSEARRHKPTGMSHEQTEPGHQYKPGQAITM